MSLLPDLVYGFAWGDALGAEFESKSPSIEQIHERLDGDSVLSYTDDTKLLLSTVHALKKHHRSLDQDFDQTFWAGMRAEANQSLLEWYCSGDLRGMGKATQVALRQLKDHADRGLSLDAFELQFDDYPYDTSAGNGVLARALPLLALGFEVDACLIDFLSTTHLHSDGLDTVRDLDTYLRTGELRKDLPWTTGQGFYAPETLKIAVDAIKNGKGYQHAFELTQVSEGSNDSTAALALGLWFFKRGRGATTNALTQRLQRGDQTELETVLNG
ncbi:MAG: ADP-ribosylglycohydrolase family protein [Methylotenera sp.]|nr:ADP-ribosylglycohydrolase family protein [Oligoflexia bacterium]